jgi:hypothetical protein
MPTSVVQINIAGALNAETIAVFNPDTPRTVAGVRQVDVIGDCGLIRLVDLFKVLDGQQTPSQFIPRIDALGTPAAGGPLAPITGAPPPGFTAGVGVVGASAMDDPGAFGPRWGASFVPQSFVNGAVQNLYVSGLGGIRISSLSTIGPHVVTLNMQDIQSGLDCIKAACCALQQLISVSPDGCSITNITGDTGAPPDPALTPGAYTIVLTGTGFDTLGPSPEVVFIGGFTPPTVDLVTVDNPTQITVNFTVGFSSSGVFGLELYETGPGPLCDTFDPAIFVMPPA